MTNQPPPRDHAERAGVSPERPRLFASARSAAAVLGALVLSEAPRYGDLARKDAFHTSPAIVGGLLILPWFWHLSTRSRKDRPTRTVAQWRRRAWRTWMALLVIASIFAITTIARAGIHLTAPLIIATFGTAVAVVWTATSFALALRRQDHAAPIRRLLWLTVPPGCLLGPTITFVALGDTWATLLFGCFSTGLGALLCDLWTPAPPRDAAPTPHPHRS
jgi:hypothetical protein